MVRQKGVFVISLDFELHWGSRDSKTVASYRETLLGARLVVPALLKLFREYGIHATWATVGFLFFETRDELMAALPDRLPKYANRRLSPYEDLARIGDNEKEDPFHFAPSLIRMIRTFPHQEIGTHTFSHYYCLEEHQDTECFRADVEAAIQAAKKYDLILESLVFPRNQSSAEYISVCKSLGIKCYRGNQKSWFYQPRRQQDESLLRRGLRLADAYINLSGRNCYSRDTWGCEWPINIPASRFLRPCSARFGALERRRLRRILCDLEYAADGGFVYHLWWHPHNFGGNPQANLLFLEKILVRFTELRETCGMESLNMREAANRVYGAS